MSGPLVVLGDALLDRDLDGEVERLCPEAPVPVVDELVSATRPGGAALAATLAALDGEDIVLVTALARDEAGLELARLLDGAGVEVVDLGLEGRTPEKVRVRAGGRLLLRVDRGGEPAAVANPDDGALAVLRSAAAVLVADYGRGVTSQPELRRALEAMARRVAIVWDPHPRGSRPVAGVRLVTPNRSEAAAFAPRAALAGDDATAWRARRLVAAWRADAVAVTLGDEGALLVERDERPVRFRAPIVLGGDPCGAGDRFAAAAAAALRSELSTLDAVESAVLTASAFVAAGGAGGVAILPAPWRADAGDLDALLARVRSRGGTVVATGGCFDLLHAGHATLLETARGLGDCLVVCLNSDASVRRLKGSDRPLVPEEDRAALLRSLASVDAVVLFDEDTPAAALERLRPDIFAKGGDYRIEELPEARVLERWGGRAVLLPYVTGRSTTRLIESAQLRA